MKLVILLYFDSLLIYKKLWWLTYALINKNNHYNYNYEEVNEKE